MEEEDDDDDDDDGGPWPSKALRKHGVDHACGWPSTEWACVRQPEPASVSQGSGKGREERAEKKGKDLTYGLLFSRGLEVARANRPHQILAGFQEAEGSRHGRRPNEKRVTLCVGSRL